jgi:hypothetical protein
MNLEKEKDVYYLKYIVSSDNGKTWSPPQDITTQISKPEWQPDFKFITSGRGIQTKEENYCTRWSICKEVYLSSVAMIMEKAGMC